jgi:hypothetical protein
MLAGGRFSAHQFEVVEGDLEGWATGLSMLKAGKTSGVKFVFKIGEV